jgi:hypothetical protein
MKKAILGGLLGGLALFVWGMISHMDHTMGRFLAGLVLARVCRDRA